QEGLVPGPAVGSLAHVASEGTWTFFLDLINLGVSQAQARVNFFDDAGDPLLMPLTFPQQEGVPAPLLGATLERPIAPNAQIVLKSAGSHDTVPLTGSGQLLAGGSVSGFGIFSYPPLAWNALVPLETRNARSYILAFDNSSDALAGLNLT